MHMSYRERLTAGVGTWLAVLGLAITAGVALLPVSGSAALAAMIFVLGLFAFMLWRSMVVLQVDDTHLVAPPAKIELELLGRVEALDAEAMRQARGRELHPDAYLCSRAWISTGVRVWLQDPDDETPYWVISSRHPDRLAAALTRAGQGRQPTS